MPRDSEHTLAEFIRAERVRFVFIQAALPIFFSPIAAAILSFALWPVVSHRLLVGWTAGLVAIAAVRVVLVRSFPRTELEESAVRSWERLFIATVLLVDLWWGIGGLFLLTEPYAARALVFSFVMLMAGGHSASYSAHPATVTLGVLALTVPITVLFAFQGDVFHGAMAFTSIMFLAATFRSIKTLGYFFEHTHRLAHELQQERDRVAELARSDFLTALNNRRAFYELSEAGLAQSSVTAVLMIDIDHFKKINDERGHAAGDAVIRAIADVIREHLREGDIAARVGGEEFAVLMPETPYAAAATIAESLRASVEARTIEHDGESLCCTISVGVATLRSSDTLDALIARADSALYDAKHSGRNRVA